jgi:hypothetical protein
MSLLVPTVVTPRSGLVSPLGTGHLSRVIAMGGDKPPRRKPPEGPGRNRPPKHERRRDQPDERLRRAPDKHHCCAREEDLVTPTGEQESMVRRTSGSLWDGYTYYVRPVPFVRSANFQSEGEGCACTCCEYREQIKGSFLARKHGAAADQFWPWPPVLDMALSANGQSVNYVRVSETEWSDSSLPVGIGNPIRVGRRNDIQPRPGSNAVVEQDYDTPCSYWLDFYPQTEFMMGYDVKIDVQFRAAIVDVCDNERVVVGWRQWNWKLEGDLHRLAH